MLSVLGLTPDYVPDGRVISQAIAPDALPAGLRDASGLFAALAATYKQLNAPFGDFGHWSEVVSTKAVKTNSPGDAVYLAWDAQLQRCGTDRDTVAGQMKTLLDAAEFGGATLDPAQATTLLDEGQALISELQSLAAGSAPPAATVCHI